MMRAISRTGLLLVLILFPLRASAQLAPSSSVTTDKSQATVLIWMGCEGTNCAGLTIDASAGGKTLTSAKYNPTVTDQPAIFSRAQAAVCYNTGAKIWFTPTSTITLSTGKGFAVLDGGTFTIYGYTNIAAFHAIRDAAVSSTLYCDYYKQP